ncbi:MAG: cyanophycinase [Bacteroidota bacterium]
MPLRLFTFLFLLTLTFNFSCTPESGEEVSSSSITSAPLPQGDLFIIGGGKRPPSLITDLLKIAKVQAGQGQIMIFPQASSEPDTSAFYAKKQFLELGIRPDQLLVYTDSLLTSLDQLVGLELIYFCGGDQNRLMDFIQLDSPLYQALRKTYQKGSTMAGTSAGAAIMSEIMITGNEKRYPEYTGFFRTIEADNIETARGMGFLQDVIVDQHFIYRMRMNRLITAVLEQPGKSAFGIDESTAVHVFQDSMQVYGQSQVIVLHNPNQSVKQQETLLSGEGLILDVRTAGSAHPLPGK